MIKVAITGHRPSRLNGKEDEVKKWIIKTLKELGPKNCYCFSGLAQGTDQIFAEACMDMNIPLVCTFPYKSDLSEEEKKFYDYAEQVYYQSDKLYKNCAIDCDKWMVDHSDVVLVVWDGTPSGGSYYTMKYAEDQVKTIILFPGHGGEI